MGTREPPAHRQGLQAAGKQGPAPCAAPRALPRTGRAAGPRAGLVGGTHAARSPPGPVALHPLACRALPSAVPETADFWLAQGKWLLPHLISQHSLLQGQQGGKLSCSAPRTRAGEQEPRADPRAVTDVAPRQSAATSPRQGASAVHETRPAAGSLRGTFLTVNQSTAPIHSSCVPTAVITVWLFPRGAKPKPHRHPRGWALRAHGPAPPLLLLRPHTRPWGC